MNARLGYRGHEYLVGAILVVVLALAMLTPQRAEAAFPGENGLIAFSDRAGTSGGNFDIYAMSSAGQFPASIAMDGVSEADPAFSPDGERIAYSRADAPEGLLTFDIWVMNDDGSGKTNLTENPSNGDEDTTPAFSPDGKKIVFIRALQSGGPNDIWIMNSDGTSQTNLTSATDLSPYNPSISPDGQRVVFEAGDGPSSQQIFSIAINGTDLVNLTDTGAGVSNYAPDYSPDGSQIVFGSDRDGAIGEVFVMDSDGADPVNLTNNNPILDTGPSFSPDGERIVFLSEPGDIKVMSADGSNQQKIGVTVWNRYPAWGSATATPNPPKASLSVTPSVVQTGEAVQLDASASTNPAGAAITDYQWDLDGDGIFELDTGTSPSTTHGYNDRGAVAPRVRVAASTGSIAVASGAVEVRLASRPGPIGVSIEAGAQYTNDPNVEISARWPRLASTLTISNDGGFTPFSVEPVDDAIQWKLDSSGPERLPKTVYVRFQGGESGPETYQDDIILDETPPTIQSASASGASASSSASAEVSKRKKVKLRVKAKDKTSGVKRMQITNKKKRPGKWKKYKSTAKYKSRGKKIFVRVQDGAKNKSRWKRAKR